MITIAPPELCSGLTPGQTVKLKDLITRAYIRDYIKAVNGKLGGGNHGGNTHPLQQPVLVDQYRNRITSKYFYQNCCRVALGHCDRCRASDCADRDWRNRGYVP